MRRFQFIFVLLLFCFQSVSQSENGQASYYGDKFHGRSTASGEKYDRNEFTAAHRSYPFNTIVEVTNLDNGKSVLVRVNDRGPFIKGRIIDVSKAAAIELNMLAAGVANVSVRVVQDTERETIAKAPTKAIPKNLYEVSLKNFDGGGYGIQLVSFEHIDNLFNEIMRIENEYKMKPLVHVSQVKGKRVYRLIIGPFSSRDKAEKKARKLHKKGKDGIVVDLLNLD